MPKNEEINTERLLNYLRNDKFYKEDVDFDQKIYLQINEIKWDIEKRGLEFYCRRVRRLL